ncbi:alpha/beta fold hydrolase [Rhodococcus sp. 21391]|uniref:alpha/beta fold hydrolase n=1 Tax=Rhodococcus sp. 21391 TaxID=2683591 RepID=UPI001ED8ECE1|nr:alpha/beta hydrolase [Rhodococcus sp. 21391]
MQTADRTTQFVRTSDSVIEVVREGTGPSVVLLPSLGPGSYDPVAAGLADHNFHVSRPQSRGIGGSEGPLEAITLHDLAADIATVIEDQDNGPAMVVGHAYGHYVARTLAAHRPALVRGVVVAAAGGEELSVHTDGTRREVRGLLLPGRGAPRLPPQRLLRAGERRVRVVAGDRVRPRARSVEGGPHTRKR